jgi:carboxypeptidase Q
VRKSAIVIASAVYHLAMRDELLPRLTRDKMPPLPPRRGEQTPATAPATPSTTTRPNNNR